MTMMNVPTKNETDQRLPSADLARYAKERLRSLERAADEWGAEKGSDRYMDILAYRALLHLTEG